tara:strand:- start:214 stop:564 length:351 start_codon:yes stop_codon:yes gene_type:complete
MCRTHVLSHAPEQVRAADAAPPTLTRIRRGKRWFANNEAGINPGAYRFSKQQALAAKAAASVAPSPPPAPAGCTSGVHPRFGTTCAACLKSEHKNAGSCERCIKGGYDCSCSCPVG